MSKNIFLKSQLFVLMAVFIFVLAILIGPNIENSKNRIINYKDGLIKKGKYQCCLKDPCNYCLIKEGECDCLEEIVNGESPCGECIGEILEGNGNKYLRKYFAEAISEKIGGDYKDEIKIIISEKYGIPVEEQL